LHGVETAHFADAALHKPAQRALSPQPDENGAAAGSNSGCKSRKYGIGNAEFSVAGR
jgi:hypothetical protein